jgi:hypothetical protein
LVILLVKVKKGTREMNAYELADFVEISKPDDKSHQMIASMLRHQADYIKHLEEGLESSIKLNKAQAERQ